MGMMDELPPRKEWAYWGSICSDSMSRAHKPAFGWKDSSKQTAWPNDLNWKGLVHIGKSDGNRFTQQLCLIRAHNGCEPVTHSPTTMPTAPPNSPTDSPTIPEGDRQLRGAIELDAVATAPMDGTFDAVGTSTGTQDFDMVSEASKNGIGLSAAAAMAYFAFPYV